MVNGLGERLKQQRKLRNLSQKQVAEVIGVSPSIISNYESGERTPSLETFIALTHLFHCSANYLLGLVEKTESANSADVSMLDNRQQQLLQQFLDELQ